MTNSNVANEKMTFEAIYKLHYPKVVSYLTYKISSRVIAEELANDIMLKVSNFLDCYNPEISALTTWIGTITKNIMIDYFRSNTRKNQAKNLNVSDYVNEDGTESYQWEAGIEHNNLENKYLNNRIEQSFNMLTKNEKLVAQSILIDGKKYKEVAAELGLTRHNVCILLTRSRAKMQKELDNVKNY